MPGSSEQRALKRRARDRAGRWKRVGAFVRKRRDELRLSQGDIIRALGYASRNAVSNIEVGIEGLPAKRAYAWADVLEVPRDAFFRFVTGETDRLEVPKTSATHNAGDRLSMAETEMLASYRRLPPKYRRRLREQAQEYEMLARASRATRAR